MSSYQLSPEEILYLLNAAGVSRPSTMTDDEFTLPESTQAAAPQADVDALQALVNYLAAPEVVVRIWRQDGESTARDVWYYWGGDSAVSIEQTESGVFELADLSDSQPLLTLVESSIALRPLPADLDFYAVLQREDFLAVRDLADVWSEVPALEILEADGLDKLSAKELFDVAAEPEWRAQVNFSGLRDDGNIERVLRVAQGPMSAWMAKPLDENVTRVRVETVQEGEVAALLRAYWADVNAYPETEN